MNIIAIDCGASFLKAALFQDAYMVKEIYRKAPKVHGDEDTLVPVQIVSLVKEVQSIISELTQDVKEATVCISNEMHGFILADENGNPFTDYISWQKEFGNIEIDGESSKAILSGASFHEQIVRSGMPIRAGLPSTNLMYLYKVGLLNKCNTKLYFYTLGDYLIKAVTGSEPNCHLTNAAATGMIDLTTGQWNDVLIKAVCNKNVVFPSINNEKVSIRWNDCQLYFLPAVGDQQAALMGAGLTNTDDLSFNLGTGAQVSKLITNLEFSSKFQTRPYFNGKYIKSIPHLPSGRAMNVFVRFIAGVLTDFGHAVDEDTIWKVIMEKVVCTEKTDIKCDLSFFENSITNHTNGGITNIPEYGLDIGTLFESIFRKMAINFIGIADIVEDSSMHSARLIFSGGVAKRIDYIRNLIIEHYPDASTVIAPDNEVLYGLLKYGQQIDEN